MTTITLQQLGAVPVSQMAHQSGVKALVHGGPGAGKTPIIQTAPRPITLFCEPGVLSLRDWDGLAVDGSSKAQIDGFFAWLEGSAEAGQFDTVAVDSVSEMAEIYLRHYMSGTSKAGNKVNGMAAYGDMAKDTMKNLFLLNKLQEKHVYLIAKQLLSPEDDGVKKRPYFPGKQLNTEVPHLFDLIMELGQHNVPGHGTFHCFRTADSFSSLARDRSRKLNEYEQPDLAYIFNKCLA